MKSPLLYIVGLSFICWATLSALVGCATLSAPPPSDTPARIARIDAGIVEAQAVAVEARALGREDIAVEAETKGKTLADLRARLDSPAPGLVAAGQDLATGLSAVWPPFAFVASGLAGLAEFLRRKAARHGQIMEMTLEEVSQQRNELENHFTAASVVVEALERPEAAPARKAVANLAKDRDLNDKVETLLRVTRARQPRHV